MAFFVAGFGVAAWAPLVPFAKQATALSDGELGLVLLCVGIGSLIAMPTTGFMVSRFGCRAVIITDILAMACCLPLLMLSGNPVALGAVLMVFGGSVGSLDVAANIQAVILERATGQTMMSNFHGMFSAGGISGAGAASAMLWLGLTPLATTLCVDLVILMLLAGYGLWLLPVGGGVDSGRFTLPRGRIAIAAAACFVLFLAEGAILDWSAVFLTSIRSASESTAGLAYAGFAAAMTLGRLNGDRLVQRLGPVPVMVAGSVCAAAGYLLAVFVPSVPASLAGFTLVGLGASNVVPVIFSAVGRQNFVPPAAAIASITTIGYAGILAGPAMIGFIAAASSLQISLAVVGLALIPVGLCARLISRM
jgi:predicted MFS family arabinose efflux permease